MPPPPAVRSALLAFCTAALAGCAAQPRPQAPAPPLPPARTSSIRTVAAALEPPPAAVAAAAKLQPTGLELGTMWTFEKPPLAYWAREYDFHPTQPWLDHVRLSSLRYGRRCTGSFVSPDGLVMTNRHCQTCTAAVSTPGHDYGADGFYAATRAEEKACPGLYLDQLQSMEDVTARVRSAVPARAAGVAVMAALDSASRRIEQECDAATKLHCQVVSLYNGGAYHLYRYKRYTTVKLVFSPEAQAGGFGGDDDNFTYPRYALDVAFLRVYQPDDSTPLHPADYLRWRNEGAAVGEPVFEIGNPGRTRRLSTVSQLMYERQVGHPEVIANLTATLALLKPEVKGNPQRTLQLGDLSNTLKADQGEEQGLLNTLLLARKIAWERQFRERVQADPQLRSQFGDIWQRLDTIEAEKLVLVPRLTATFAYLTGLGNVLGPLQQAGLLAAVVEEKSLPDAQRELIPFQHGGLERFETLLQQPIPFDTTRGIAMLTRQLELMRTSLPPADPLLAAALEPGESPEQAARRLVAASHIGDVALRQALIRGGAAALAASPDPLVRLARTMVTTQRALFPRANALAAAEQVQQARLARAFFAVYGTSAPPDATMTLRISGGRIEGYPYNGTRAPPYTSFYGLYGRANDFHGEEPFNIAPSWVQARSRVDLATYMDQVSTNDITGGNSGSPLVDEQARIVGLVFDENLEALPSNFIYPGENGRAISVHPAAITEALRSVYHADALVQELLTSTEHAGRNTAPLDLADRRGTSFDVRRHGKAIELRARTREGVAGRPSSGVLFVLRHLP